jgi:uncharacterized RDD family membrane protein YckC
MAPVDRTGSDPDRVASAEAGEDESLDAYAGDAGLLPRAAALVIDYGVLLVVSLVAGALIRGLGGLAGLAEGTSAALSALVTVAIIAVYFAGLESSTSQGTLGKMAMGLQVTDLRGRPIGFARALGRTSAKLLSLVPFFVGFVMAAFTLRKQALHDVLAGTLVLRVR